VHSASVAKPSTFRFLRPGAEEAPFTSEKVAKEARVALANEFTDMTT
jgi:hypothetical protein